MFRSVNLTRQWPSLLLGLLGCVFAASCAFCQGKSDQTAIPPQTIERLSLNELQARRDAIETELDQLANFNPRGGIGTVCFRSMPQPNEYSTQWVQINFDRQYEIEEIALVPAIWQNNENGYRDDGFPLEFKIFAGATKDAPSELIAEIVTDDMTLPRVAPLLIPCRNVKASWIRVEANRLSTRFHDGQPILQFAEIMVFSGSDNIALHQDVVASSEQRTGTGGAYRKENLVDGFLPYLMDGAEGEKSNPYLSGFSIGDHPTLTIDLGTSLDLTKIRIHTIEQGDTVPHALQPDFAIPEHFVMEGANQSDFSDADILWDYEPKDLFEIAPIVTQRIEPRPYRFVRLRVLRNYTHKAVLNSGDPIIGTRFGFAEIEFFSDERNVARGIVPVANYNTELDDINRPLSRITDGHNIFGEILDFRDWMQQLAKRHDLESELPLINQAIEVRIKQQESQLRIWSWIAAALAVLVVFIFLVDRILRQRAVYKTRESIAADLHDELGANLHAISLLGDLAMAAKDTPEKSHKHIERIQSLSARTSAAAKHCTNILETPRLCDDLVDEMKRCARRITADIDHELSFKGEERIIRLSARKRINVLLFYKECLVNIIRHSGATQAKTRLEVIGNELILTVSDNGHGFPDSPTPTVPRSLKRRARLSGGKVTVSKTESEGSSITLKLRV